MDRASSDFEPKKEGHQAPTVDDVVGRAHAPTDRTPGDAPFVEALSQMDAEGRAAVITRLQQTRGNRYVQRLAKRLSTGLSQGQIQRGDPATVIGVIGLVMGGVAIAQSQANNVVGNLTYDCDQMSYPDAVDIAGVDLKPKHRKAAEFFSKGVWSDNHTIFKLHGDFSDTDEPVKSDKDGRVTNRILKNVYIDLATTTTYDKSDLSFKAKGLKNPYGKPEDPRLRFVCSGRFNPLGSGDCVYRAVLEVDQHGNVNCLSFGVASGELERVEWPPNDGFKVVV
jgi:hypothetical protein